MSTNLKIKTDSLMLVSQISKILDVSPDTIRYYTRCGLVNPCRSENGYKIYSTRDLSRLRFILRAKQLGFCLADIKSLIQTSERGSTPCPLARDLIMKNLNKLDKSIEESLNLLNRMKQAVKTWDDMPNKQPNGTTICTLIEEWDKEFEQ